MSRRQHVVRTDDTTGVGNPRRLGGETTIYCRNEGSGSVPHGGDGGGLDVHVAQIAVHSDSDYRRYYVSATIDGITSEAPDPPGPGTWTVRFECGVAVPDDSPRWKTVPYSPTYISDATITNIEWDGNHDYVSFGFSGISELDSFGDFVDMWDLTGQPPGPGSEPVEPPHAALKPLRLEVQKTNGPLWCTLTFSSPSGEFIADEVITDGGYFGD